MSIYAPLARHLRAATGDELPMTFAEIEAVLGRALAPSARRHPAWWSNNVGTHVNAAAWRNAGWRTARVSIPDERVTFVREPGVGAFATTDFPPHAGLAEAGLSDPAVVGEGPWARELLAAASPAARRTVESWSEARRISLGAAVLEILDAVARDHQQRLVEALPRVTMPPGHDTTAWIREDRDAR